VTLPHRPARPWAALLVLCVANFLILLDTSIVNTALPDIMRSLGAGIDEALWVLNGYLIAFASLLIVFGRLGDLLGARSLFVGGLVVFSVASLWCGSAGSPLELVVARVVQGAGAAVLLPQALALIAAIFPPARRGAAFGMFTAVAGVAAVAGPTLGGVIITGPGWQWIFYLNVPVGFVGAILALRLVPDLRAQHSAGIDPIGVLLATSGLVGLVYGLVEGQRYHWAVVRAPISIPAILSVSVAVLALFVIWEARRADPLVPLSLLRVRGFAIGTLITLGTSFALFGFLLVFVIETQTLLGMSALGSGLTALPWTVTLCAVAPVSGRLTDRMGGRVLLVGGLVAYAAGVLGVALLPGQTSGWTAFVVPLIAIGVGMGASIAPTTTVAMRDITAVRVGAASGVLNTARQVGGVLGAAVVGAVLQNRLSSTLHDQAVQRAAQLPPPLREPFVRAFTAASDRGLRLGSQHGGVEAPAALDPALSARFDALVDETFRHSFLPAARPALGLIAIVLLAVSVTTLMLPPARADAGTPVRDGDPGPAVRQTPG
jgi:EmrB/QacA subfamily drug resistance transporter